MNIDLEFHGTGAPGSGGHIDLAFGTPQGATPPEAVSAAIHIRLAAPAVRIRAIYDNQVSRKLEGAAHLPWQRSRWQAGSTQDGWGDTGRQRDAAASLWRTSLPLEESIGAPTGENIRARSASRLPWEEAKLVAEATAACNDALASNHDVLDLVWRQSAPLSEKVTSRFVWLAPLPRHHALSWQDGMGRSPQLQFGFSHGLRRSKQWSMQWEIGRRPRIGESHPPAIPPEVPPEPRRHPNLDFICPSSRQELAWRPTLLLDFGTHPCAKSGFDVPILKVYFVSNSIDVVRLPGREPIPVKSVQIAIDTDSWAWGFSANLPYSALEMVEPTSSGPVEIEITINSVTWVMLVEGFEARREFGQSALSIRGRSLAAYLAEPYASKRSFAPHLPFTARQLAEQELTRADRVTGFELEWRLPDWLVDAGAWSYQAQSPIGAIGRIVESVGGYVHAHPRLKTLVAKSSYPELPWHWESMPADRTLPIDVVKTLNLRWQEKPAFNAVIVSGERQGVTGRVIRSGTAGDILAPMVVDSLITHPDAARERGRSILADTGKQALVTLELPMLNSVGLLDPGLLIAVGDGGATWRGLVRATNIAASWNDGLTVRQTIEVERHFV